MYILQVNQEPYTSNLFTSTNMHPQNSQEARSAHTCPHAGTTDFMHALMQRSTIILHLHHQFKDGLIQGLINNVTWIDDMAQGVALIPPLNYKYPLTPSHSTHLKGATPPLSRCRIRIALLEVRESARFQKSLQRSGIFLHRSFVRLKYSIYLSSLIT